MPNRSTVYPVVPNGLEVWIDGSRLPRFSNRIEVRIDGSRTARRRDVRPRKVVDLVVPGEAPMAARLDILMGH